jgi:hypothetical protein
MDYEKHTIYYLLFYPVAPDLSIILTRQAVIGVRSWKQPQDSATPITQPIIQLVLVTG